MCTLDFLYDRAAKFLYDQAGTVLYICIFWCVFVGCLGSAYWCLVASKGMCYRKRCGGSAPQTSSHHSGDGVRQQRLGCGDRSGGGGGGGGWLVG